MSYSRTPISENDIKKAISSTHSMIEAARYLGVSRDRFNRYAKLYGLFNPNRPGKGIVKKQKYTDENIFQKSGENCCHSILLKRIWKYKEHRCENCGLTEWMNKPITLEIHHIDGNHHNNELSNLQILCPNCHSQTTNWRSRNKKIYNKNNPKITDEDLLAAIKKYPNINLALKSLGLAGGSNYNRVYKLLKKYSIDIFNSDDLPK